MSIYVLESKATVAYTSLKDCVWVNRNKKRKKMNY